MQNRGQNEGEEVVIVTLKNRPVNSIIGGSEKGSEPVYFQMENFREKFKKEDTSCIKRVKCVWAW